MKQEILEIFEKCRRLCKSIRPDAEEMDEELLGWIKEASVFSEVKRNARKKI